MVETKLESVYSPAAPVPQNSQSANGEAPTVQTGQGQQGQSADDGRVQGGLPNNPLILK